MFKKPSIRIPEKFKQYRALIEETIRPVIRIQTTERKTTLFESKFAGDPYFPTNLEYPKNGKGLPLKLLAQINFSEIPAHLPHFPTEGILQFYIDGYDDVWGMDFDNGQNQADFRIIYHEKITQDESQLVQDFSFVNVPNEELVFPVEKEMGLSFEKDIEALTTNDYRHEEIYAPIFEMINDDADVEDEFYEFFEGPGHKLGGYPFFTQEDPRAYGDYQDADLLLLQIDSIGDYILWGDVGVANFFISQNDLENKDFSRVLYNWDCS